MKRKRKQFLVIIAMTWKDAEAVYRALSVKKPDKGLQDLIPLLQACGRGFIATRINDA